MKHFKKHPKKQLEKFSNVFMQLGLVLALFIVFISLEHKSNAQAAVIDFERKEITEIYDWPNEPPVIVKEIPVEEIVPKQKPTNLDEIKKIDNEDPVTTTVIELPNKKPTTKITDLTKLKEVDEGDDIDVKDDPVLIKNIQNAPVFKGCEGLSEREGRKCLERKIAKHVQRYFNADLAQDVGLAEGKYRISTQFVIDKQGNITDVKIRAPHKRLEKEANKVVNKLPKFTPGKQNDEPAKVMYRLPITFRVDN